MDRLRWTLASGATAVLLLTSGCRNLRSEVPPGRPFPTDPSQAGTSGFSSDPHPNLSPLGAPTSERSLGAAPGSMPGGAGQLGTPAPGGADVYGKPTTNAYGAPGTAGGLPGGMPGGTDPIAPIDGASTAPQIPNTLGAGLADPGSTPAPDADSLSAPVLGTTP